MARGDFVELTAGSATGGGGARVYNVAYGTPIYAGEPVQQVLAGTNVFPAITSTPVVGTHYYVGIAATDSSNTTTLDGQVWVYPLTSNVVWLCAPATAASWDTQAEYTALVGARVLVQNSVTVTATPTSGTYTILASDSANNGCQVQALDIFKYPGKVAVVFRAATAIAA